MVNVSYYLQVLPTGRTKAIFTVPESLASTLTLHPVLCRGGVFRLQVDAASQKWMRTVSGGDISTDHHHREDSVGFLSTEYESPDPEATALAIAQRLESRVDDSASTALSVASYMGFL
jgi:hypothetical protein